MDKTDFVKRDRIEENGVCKLVRCRWEVRIDHANRLGFRPGKEVLDLPASQCYTMIASLNLDDRIKGRHLPDFFRVPYGIRRAGGCSGETESMQDYFHGEELVPLSRLLR